MCLPMLSSFSSVMCLLFTFTTNKRSVGSNTLPLSNFKILVNSIQGVPEYQTIFEIHVN